MVPFLILGLFSQAVFAQEVITVTTTVDPTAPESSAAADTSETPSTPQPAVTTEVGNWSASLDDFSLGIQVDEMATDSSRNRRSMTELTKLYNLLMKYADNILTMSPRTQDFMLVQGVKIFARKVGVILRDILRILEVLITKTMESLGLKHTALVHALDQLGNSLAQAVEDYIYNMPHPAEKQ